MTVARPALAEVLGAVTHREPYLRRALDDGYHGPPAAVVVEAARVGYRQTAFAGVTEGSTTWHAFTVTGPAEALEVLHTRGLWPWVPGDEAAPRWWCKCNGADGVWRGDVSSVCGMTRNGQRGCGGKHWTQPPDLAAVVAVASLGVTTLATVAALAGEVQPGAAVVWRALSRDAIQEHHRGCEARRTQSPVALVFSREARDDEWEGVRMQMRERNGRKRWSEACPYYGWFGTGGDDDPHGVHRAWPALRALHDCGVHLLACDPARVVLGVEALS